MNNSDTSSNTIPSTDSHNIDMPLIDSSMPVISLTCPHNYPYDVLTQYDTSNATSSDGIYLDSTLNDTLNTCNSDSSTSISNSVDLKLKAKGMKIGHMNIQGIQNKTDELDIMLNRCNNDIHIFGLSETKLKSLHPDNCFMLDNYQFFRKDRVVTNDRQPQGGGIVVYVKNGVKAIRRCDLESNEIECVWLEIFPNKTKSFLVGVLYRHPNATIQWNEHFEELIEKVLETQKEIYLLGDFNRDLLNEQTRKAWLEFMEPYGLFQKVQVVTRKSNHSQTLIDHIYCNVESNVNSINVPEIGLSDHYPIFVTRKCSTSIPKFTHHTITYRSFKQFNKDDFINDLESTPWDIIKVFDDTNEIVDTWSSLFLKIVDKHLPLKTQRVKHKTQPKWLTPDILEAIKTRDRYKSINEESLYKVWRNKVTLFIKK